MSKFCKVTKKGPLSGNKKSRANNRTRRRFFPNLKYKRFWSEKDKCFVSLRVCTAGIRLIDKKGLDTVLAEMAFS